MLSKDATVDLARLLPAVTDGRPFHRGGAPPPELVHVLQGWSRRVLRDQNTACARS